ncbi:protein tyrosine kinase, putative [Bodo saltans]|uniref:Protein tyrosine kinase, putative n=1 Tax=Bodo saltans TaxID=75058 RepID=A0A0S4IPY0_BODSA|nr:protein tyrosine kinase, putative [Bodo saltans]|eukprot:CUF08096.1 protein tyrosine kinase, putative [Bodo saltans]
MRAIVNKIVAKGQSEASKAPTLTNLLQPRTSRNLSREIEEWLVTHDIITLLEGLTVHLLRTLPYDEIEETDKWLDGKKVSKSATAALQQDDVTLTTSEGWRTSGGATVMDGVWQNQPVSCVMVKRQGLAMGSAAIKAHQHSIACLTATVPQICSVTHEGVLPTYGYWSTDDSIGLLHARISPESCLTAQLHSKRSHLTTHWVLTVAQGVLSGLGHLHTLGYLHRNINTDCIFELYPQQYVIGGFDFTVRSSRGRITAPAWAPRVPAPEVLHTRTFESSTDVFAFGVLMLEMCSYGAPLSLPLPVNRPPHIPVALWKIVTPCLNVSRDARPTCHAVLAGGRSVDGVPDTPCQRRVQSRHGMTQHVAIENVQEADWSVVEEAMHRNDVVTELSLRNCHVGASSSPLPKRHLTHLSIDNVTLNAGSFLHRPLRDYIIVAGASLVELRLSNLDIHPAESMCSLLRGLPGWTPQLSLLSLTALGLSSDTLRSLCDALGEPDMWPSLHRLELGRGDILPSYGVSSLCTALLRDHRVRTLCLSGAVLDYFGVGQLAQLIRESKTLTEVSLVGVALGEVGGRVIDSAKRHAVNNTLQVLL